MKYLPFADDEIESYDSNSDMDDEEGEVKCLLFVLLFYFFM